MKRIQITEVGPRDGLQNEKTVISTNDKKVFIELLKNSGLYKIEVTSFVRPDRIPALSDSSELSDLLDISHNPNFSCLVPNDKGLDKALEKGYREIAIFGAASETFQKKNINMSKEESLGIFSKIARRARENDLRVRGYISTITHCPYEGKIDPSLVLESVKYFYDFGVYEISLGDTIGKAVPKDVEDLLSLLFKSFPKDLFAMHFHDTYGTALANVQKSLDMGILSFDSSAGGLGGCPYAPGASGNLATEDLVYLLNNSGYETGVDLTKLIKASQYMENILGRNLNSRTYQAFKATQGTK